MSLARSLHACLEIERVLFSLVSSFTQNDTSRIATQGLGISCVSAAIERVVNVVVNISLQQAQTNKL